MKKLRIVSLLIAAVMAIVFAVLFILTLDWDYALISFLAIVVTYQQYRLYKIIGRI